MITHNWYKPRLPRHNLEVRTACFNRCIYVFLYVHRIVYFLSVRPYFELQLSSHKPRLNIVSLPRQHPISGRPSAIDASTACFACSFATMVFLIKLFYYYSRSYPNKAPFAHHVKSPFAPPTLYPSTSSTRPHTIPIPIPYLIS